MVIQVKTKSDLKKFVRFPTKLYDSSSFYVPPLEVDELKMFSSKNPFWDSFVVRTWIAVDGKKVVGRIAAIIYKNRPEICRFTRFDFVDDFNVSEALVNVAIDFAKQLGCTKVHGPLGFSDFDRQGLLVEGFDKLSTFETSYNYAYYAQHLERLGFIKEWDWVEYLIPVVNQDPTRLARIVDRIVERGNFYILPKTMSATKLLKVHYQQIFDLIDKSYSFNDGYIPLNTRMRKDLIKQFKLVLQRDFISLVFTNSDCENLVGFACVLPSIARSAQRSRGRMFPWGWLRLLREAKKPKHVDLAIIAVHHDYREQGINAILCHEIMVNSINRGILTAESNLELETNNEIQAQMNAFEGKQLVKRRRCYVFHPK